LELRRARREDAEAIRNLARAAYAKWVPVIGREPKPMAADYETAVLEHRFDLLYADGVLVGLIETVDEKNRLLVENVAISPDHQGRGLGSRLMAHAEELAASLGHDCIWLYTNKRFTENVALYLKLGYRVDGEEDLGDSGIRLNMSKRPARPA
jgi:ribosomal protein S18 acetylase RimI-like enzyme